jgi:hypothetical protein
MDGKEGLNRVGIGLLTTTVAYGRGMGERVLV